ncbi:MAG: hypothetical protein AAFV78_20070 [Bacteroidota bacterium]
MKYTVIFLIACFTSLCGIHAQTTCDPDSVQATVTDDTVCIGEPIVFSVALNPLFFQGIDSVRWSLGNGDSSGSLAFSKGPTHAVYSLKK